METKNQNKAGEPRVLRVRGGNLQNDKAFDDRFELESRGKFNATGLSGTSDPDNYSKEAAAG